MEAPVIAQFARNFSVMVRVQGPDPKGLKMRRNAFHLHQSGKTTISASGLLLLVGSLSQMPTIIEYVLKIHQFSGAVVVTVASVVDPFLIAEHRNKPGQEFSPRLIHDGHVDILVEGKKASNGYQGPEPTSEWLPAKLLALVDVPAASDALLSLVGGQSSWEASWSLAPLNVDQHFKVGNDAESRKDHALEESNNPAHLAKLATRIAFLGISTLDIKDGPHINISLHQKRGDPILVVGSPFGVLSPQHFYNSISVGHLANCCPSGSGHSSLLLADIRCLPGMEGGPIFDSSSFLVGILARPLRQKGGNAEIQFAVAWDAIERIQCNIMNLSEITKGEIIDRMTDKYKVATFYRSNDCRPGNALLKSLVFSTCSSSSLEMTSSSVVLIATSDGSWASGVVLNKNGLILTNAHILEPWRFGRASVLTLNERATSSYFELNRMPSSREENFTKVETGTLLPSWSRSSSGGHKESLLSFSYRSSKGLSVRVDYMEEWTWYNAKVVYVSKGPLDVALLQLESTPLQLFPITYELACPSEGSIVHVVGHGLLSPRSNIAPSITSGVLSNVVHIPGPLHICAPSKTESRTLSLPVMLQTTAAVHPGASGGAVINSDGHMIGLVTSNARHGGGTIIPHLNFSIPCAALEPIFKFSDNQDSSIFQFLDEPNELLSSVWALVPPPSAKTQSESGRKNMNFNEGKGSRFSQFLAEKNVNIASLEELQHLKKINLPSKI